MSEPNAPEGLRCIVAAVDFSPASDRALQWAAALAARRGARLRLVHAVPVFAALDMPTAAASLADEGLIASAQACLAEREEAVRGVVRSVEAELTFGTPTVAILETVERHRPELLVLGTRGLAGWRSLLLGGTAARVLGAATCPVLAVHDKDPRPPDRPLRLLAASDGSDDAREAIRAAARLFELSPRAFLVHGFRPPIVLFSDSGRKPVRDLVAAARAMTREWMAAEASRLASAGIDVDSVLEDGHAPDVIAGALRNFAVDVVAVGSRGRGGVAQLLLGSTAERVIQRANRPVLVVPRRAARASEEARGALSMVASA